MVKVSIILPVYGVAQYIEKCTQSLLVQTLDDMEFLFVDDHGPDNSIELVKTLIAGNPRETQFRFLKPEHNLGAGMARNFAIPQAKGEYIAFVDSDDWVEPTMFAELYNEAKRQDDADLCCCQVQKDYTDGQHSETVSNPIVESGAFDKVKKEYFLAHYVSMFSSFLMKRSMIEQYHIRFPEERCADDSYFIGCCLMTATSIARVDKPFYHYVIRPGSVTTTRDSTKYKKRLAVFAKLMLFAKDCGAYREEKEVIDFIYLKKGYLASVFNYLYNSSEPTIDTLHKIHDELLFQVPGYKYNRYLRKRTSLRALMCLIRCCPRIAMRIIPRYVKKTHQVV